MNFILNGAPLHFYCFVFEWFGDFGIHGFVAPHDARW
jgi:hypothetical protein